MKFLSLKTLKLVSLVLVVVLLLSQTNIIGSLLSPQKAYAVADLTVSWEGAGSGTTGPMFSVANMVPGESSQKTITIQNGSESSRPLGIKGLKTNETGNLGDAMEIVISRNGSDLYGGTNGTKTLTLFFEDSSSANGIALGTLNSGDSADFVVAVTFTHEAGNEYQEKNVTFDLHIGLSVDLPQACEGISFSKTIYGTQKNDRLNGTNGNDLIIGLEGNDKIDGGNGNDCILGNDGTDALTGGNGDDVLSGVLGDDKLDGGNGEDILFGGDGKDNLIGGNGDDILYGNGGADKLDAGNDTDSAYGGDGDDAINGGNGNDMLDGQGDTDSANGENGKDTCLAESKTKCEL